MRDSLERSQEHDQLLLFGFSHVLESVGDMFSLILVTGDRIFKG
jgi:hypothetical protein